MERQIYSTLVRDSGMSQSSIQNLFKHYLLSAPEVKIKSKSKNQVPTKAMFLSLLESGLM